ncbi:hypothetical protein [Polyangium sp. 6x1]|uniref:hypothetical protein n=1 Tax=Polyangium sp. 6x1 TaxID=3042689 RepID=UPI0024829458|nr:hypothetical protein [Polyangium sp. 6x1]MDI1447275.1 hypothetical protein [Polyangium sp. 6x1]
MMAASRFRVRPLRGSDLIEIQRSNLRALLRHLYREHGTWTKVAHLLRFRRAVVVGFFDGTEPGNIALARSIARALGLSLDDALAGMAPPRKAPALALVTPPKRKGGGAS